MGSETLPSFEGWFFVPTPLRASPLSTRTPSCANPRHLFLPRVRAQTPRITPRNISQLRPTTELTDLVD